MKYDNLKLHNCIYLLLRMLISSRSQRGSLRIARQRLFRDEKKNIRKISPKLLNYIKVDKQIFFVNKLKAWYISRVIYMLTAINEIR